MNRMNAENQVGMGTLPKEAYLANPYVPFQVKNPEKYDPRKGLVRGTLFPGLELPFMGQINKNEKPATPLNELQALCFSIQELALYLDTHRDDEEALLLYRQLQKMYKEASKIYEEKCGPLNHHTVMDGPYKWLDDPWPWEYAFNREVV